MGQAWYYTRGGQQAGPVEFSQLQQLAATGQLNPAELVWCDGMPQWSAASTIPGLIPAGAQAQAAYSAPTPYGAAQSPYANPGALNYYAPPAGQFVYAGFWLRFVAFIIDYVITYIAGFVIGAIIRVAFGFGVGFTPPAVSNQQEQTKFVLVQLISGLLGLVVSWLYYALQEAGSAQATLGKRALGLKVVDMDGNPITFGRATGRFFGKILSGCTLFVGYIMAGFTEKKQGLHDIMAGTLVIKTS